MNALETYRAHRDTLTAVESELAELTAQVKDPNVTETVLLKKVTAEARLEALEAASARLEQEAMRWQAQEAARLLNESWAPTAARKNDAYHRIDDLLVQMGEAVEDLRDLSTQQDELLTSSPPLSDPGAAPRLREQCRSSNRQAAAVLVRRVWDLANPPGVSPADLMAYPPIGFDEIDEAGMSEKIV